MTNLVYTGLNNHSFRCQECHQVNNDDLFCTPYCCPERKNTLAFPSPNSSFPLEELEEIEKCIQLANQLLLTLALSGEGEEEDLRAIQENLRKLRGKFVDVHVNCEEKQLIRKGTILDAGRNFLILESTVGNTVMIPFENLLTVTRKKDAKLRDDDQELLQIGTCLRRNLTLNFSEVVAKSPYLLNLFFGIELSLLLESYVGCFVYVKAADERMEIDGILMNVNERRVEVLKDEELIGIDFDEFCYIEIENVELAALVK
ncbi:hypothetical protein [Metabacillus malikii]|uniref:DUF2642 domain-containing protein n=1 Tax=Metabacillus malikii TaxID=1504265 RepID=A0ABT9ZEK3_9BACI|nr:hypothetical protein [Metabacillus malikii]MDQ0230445.1 hypothetical protein [Metabacillus malikii]